MDANHVLPTANWPGGTFASYHAYPYYPDFLRHEPALQGYRYNNRSDPYAGYLAALRDHHAAHMPTMVTEFGVPSSLGSAHDGPLGRSQGDHSEHDAMATDAELLEMMRRTGIAGGMVFSWTDEWFKTTWNTATHHHPADSPPALARPADQRAVLRRDRRGRHWLPEHRRPGGRPAAAVGTDAGGRGVRPPGVLTDGLDKLAGRPLTIVVDTVAGGLAPPPPATGKPTGDYALTVDIGQRSAQMLLRSALDPVPSDQQASPAPTAVGVERWQPYRLLTNHTQLATRAGGASAAKFADVGRLRQGSWNPGDAAYDSRSTWQVDGNKIRFRLPWAMLWLSDPSSRTALVPNRADRPGVPTAGLAVTVSVGGERLAGGTLTWKPWEAARHSERLKQDASTLARAMFDTAGH